jgi:hypothetical protein
MIKEGDTVKLKGYYCGDNAWENNVPRKVLQVIPFANSSGFVAVADAGQPCKCCGAKSRPTSSLCISWFEKIEE